MTKNLVYDDFLISEPIMALTESDSEYIGTKDPVSGRRTKREWNTSTRTLRVASNMNKDPMAVATCQNGWVQ